MSLAYSDYEPPVTLRSKRPPLLEYPGSVTEPVNLVDLPDARGVAAPEWGPQVLSRVIELAHLAANWDGRGSAAVKIEVVSFSLGLLSGTMLSGTLAPSIIPLGHGGVQLVWSSDQTELEIEIVAPPEVIVFHRDKITNVEREFRAGTDYSEIETILATKFTR